MTLCTTLIEKAGEWLNLIDSFSPNGSNDDKNTTIVQAGKKVSINLNLICLLNLHIHLRFVIKGNRYHLALGRYTSKSQSKYFVW
mgnify:CR=1 FL=1